MYLQMLPHMGGRRDAERKRGAHKIELRGMLPPWVLDRLCHVLEEAQQSHLQVGLHITFNHLEKRGLITQHLHVAICGLCSRPSTEHDANIGVQ